MSWYSIKVCVLAESFLIPKPLIFKTSEGLIVTLNALAPALKTIPFKSWTEVTRMSVAVEELNVAMSEGLFGIVPGVQLLTLYQSWVGGLCFQVALPACAV